jgi:SAM-dependent methyltransferase
MILGRVLSGDGSFDVGLDVGCGTGYSAAALAEYCEHVHGIDPSPSMLSQATAYDRVSYLGGAAEHIPLPDASVEIITFAGSLFYADPEATREEVRRVGRDGALVVAYDFELLLDEIVRRCGVDPQVNESGYDHRTNFSGAPGFTELVVGSERVGVEVSAPELAHLLLSDSYRFDRLATRYGTSDPFPALAEALRSAHERVTIAAGIYYSKYRIGRG